MTVTLKEYIKGHRAFARSGVYLCGSLAGLTATRVLNSADYSTVGEFLETASFLLAAYAIYSFYRARKIAKKEYLASPPSSLDIGGIKKVRYIGLAALGLTILYFIAPMFLSGEGIHRKLDANHGFDAANYHASLVRAMDEMTSKQVDAYNWAVSDLELSTYVGRYGKNPSPRDVVMGEANRQIKLNQEMVSQLERKLAGMGTAIQQNERTRANALQLLGTVVPQVTYVGYSVQTQEQRKNKSLCEDIVCSDQGNNVYPPRVWYTIANTNNLQLASLPCKIEYSTQEHKVLHTKTTECLQNMRAASDGTYSIALNPGGNDDFSNGVATITFDYENAKIQHPTETWRKLNAMPDKLPELTQLEAAKRALEEAESAKAQVLL